MGGFGLNFPMDLGLLCQIELSLIVSLFLIIYSRSSSIQFAHVNYDMYKLVLDKITPLSESDRDESKKVRLCYPCSCSPGHLLIGIFCHCFPI